MLVVFGKFAPRLPLAWGSPTTVWPSPATVWPSPATVWLGLTVLCLACSPTEQSPRRAGAEECLDRYHEAAAQAQFQAYFDCMDDTSVFVGTDALEHWTKDAFMDYARPHFNKGKAWTMRPVLRHLHFTRDSTVAWFEELLDTRMKLCRGSGVMTLEKGTWKIRQYVLSATVPNLLMDDLVRLKSEHDDSLLLQFSP